MARSWLAMTALVLLLPTLNAADDPLPAHALRRLGSLRWRHGATVIALAFTPDGKRLLSAGRDGVIRLFDSTNGQQLTVLESNRGPIHAFALSPDGKTFASSSQQPEVRLRDAGTGRLLRTFVFDDAVIHCVAFSPDGKLIAAGDNEQHVRLWQTANGRGVHTMSVERSPRQLLFTRDGKHLCVSGADDTGIGIFRVDGAPVRRLPGWPSSFCLSGEGALLIADQDKMTASLHDWNTEKRLLELKDNMGEPVRSFRTLVACERGVLATGCGEGFVRVFKAEPGKLLWQQQAHQAGVKALAMSPDGKVVASADADGLILLWNTARGQLLNVPRGPAGAIVNAALSPDAARAALIDRAGRVRFYSTKDGSEEVKEGLSESQFLQAAYSPDGRTLALARTDLEIGLYDTRTFKEQRSLKGHIRPISGLAFAANGGSLFSAAQDGMVHQWDTATGQSGQVVGGRESKKVLAFALSGDGRSALIADGAAAPRLLSLELDKTLFVLPGHQGGCIAVALTPSGRVAISGGRDSMIRFWETASGAERRTLPGGSWVHSLACSPDGRLLASGHEDGRVVLWDVRSGLRLRVCEGHRGAVLALGFSKDGKRLLSAGVDTTAVIWDVSLELLRPQPLKLTATQTAALWQDLASREGTGGAEAIQSLARGGERTMALLREKVRPVREEELKGLMLDLDARRFAVRDKAIRRLTSMGRFIEARLREELMNKPVLEVRRRIEDILKEITRDERPIEEVRLLRALEVLEMLGTDAAKEFLKELAGGARDCGLTRDAKGALQRLATPGK